MTNLIEITDEQLTSTGTVALRKLARELGFKGMSSARGEDIRGAIRHARDAQIELNRVAEIEAAKAKTAPVKRDRTGRATNCTECGRKLKGDEFGELCAADREYGEWENAHSDEGHNTLEERDGVNTADCPVCHPELDPRKAVKPSRSRAGMVIVAKGTEIHKSATFRKAAEELGWTVTVQEQTYDDGDALNTRYYANAHRGEDAIQLAWDGRAYDYVGSSARLGGKDRKVRNLKEAIRFLAR